MMAVTECDLSSPGAVPLPFHWQSGRVPIIEVAHQRHLLSFGRRANKVDGFDRFFN